MDEKIFVLVVHHDLVSDVVGTYKTYESAKKQFNSIKDKWLKECPLTDENGSYDCLEDTDNEFMLVWEKLRNGKKSALASRQLIIQEKTILS